MNARPPITTIAAFAQKGGAGKSTIAIHLAVAASARSRVVLIDADPQGTVSSWGRERGGTMPFVACADSTSIQDVLSAARDEGYDMAIIDCPPHAAPGTQALLAVSDHIVIPVQPSMPDLSATQRSVALASAVGKPFTFVVNRAPARAPEVLQAIEALTPAGTVAPVTIGDRRAFARALTDGIAVTEFAPAGSKAVQEILAYWNWLEGHINGIDTWQARRAA